MPFLSKRTKSSDGSPDEALVNQTRPLIYAPSTTSSFHSEQKARSDPTQTKDPLHVSGVRDGTHKLITSDIFADIEQHKREKAAAAAKRAEARRLAGEPEEDEAEVVIDRPATPPQGSRRIPWESYHDLPADHPVFRLPQDVREKMYAKGVGTSPLQLVLVSLVVIFSLARRTEKRHKVESDRNCLIE